MYILCFSVGQTDGRQHIGLYFTHKHAHAVGGWNSSVRVGGVDNNHNMVEPYVKRLLQVENGHQQRKYRRSSRIFNNCIIYTSYCIIIYTASNTKSVTVSQPRGGREGEYLNIHILIRYTIFNYYTVKVSAVSVVVVILLTQSVLQITICVYTVYACTLLHITVL